MLACCREPDDMNVFDVQAESETPTRIEFRGNESRWEALFYLGACGLVLAYLIPMGGSSAILGGVFFGSLLLLVAFGKAFGEVDRSVHLAFDEEGLTVPHIFARKLPWIAVQSYSFVDRDNGWALNVGLAESKLYEPHKLNFTSFLKPWPLTSSGFRLPLDGVAGDEKDIELAFRRFAPQVRKV